jgi:hypothetical protein
MESSLIDAQHAERVATDEAANRSDAVTCHFYTFPVVSETPRRHSDDGHDQRW